MSKLQTKSTLDYLHEYNLKNTPEEVVSRAKLCILDLIGIAAGGSKTKMSKIICNHAAQQFGGSSSILFSSKTASPVGSALAGGITIDALDGHDGFNPAKGHIGCALLPGIMSLISENSSGTAFLEAMILGYEFGSRLGGILHETVNDYHTSGAWMSVAVAGIGSRLLNLSQIQSEHALGIAEYHGPRSQMMREIDYPTMVKDGSGWGSMAGVSAALLAKDGFTGAPATTLTDKPDTNWWGDLGNRWRIMEQYFKPYPVCRWAHAPIEAALKLRKRHAIKSRDIKEIEIKTFHEAVRLATNKPKTTEEAQYSTSFPLAIALAKGYISPFDLDDGQLNNKEIMRLSQLTKMSEDHNANTAFPEMRIAQVKIVLQSGQVYLSDWETPKWDHESPPSEDEITEKYKSICYPILGEERSEKILECINNLHNEPISNLKKLVMSEI